MADNFSFSRIVRIVAIVLIVISFLIGGFGLLFYFIHVPYVQSTCTITKLDVSRGDDEDGTFYNPQAFLLVKTKDGRTVQSEPVDIGRTERDANKAIQGSGYQLHQTLPCWYNPANPHQVIITENSLIGCIAFIPGLILIIALFVDRLTRKPVTACLLVIALAALIVAYLVSLIIGSLQFLLSLLPSS